MKVLLVTANFRESYIDVEREHRTLQRIVESKNWHLQVLPAAEIVDLRHALLRTKEAGGTDILHFSGHATPEEGLHFRGPGRTRDFLAAEQLKNVLKNTGIKLVVLNACGSGALARAASEVVPAAIGTTRTVRDVVARQFTRDFYGAFTENSTIKAAFETALENQKPAAKPAYMYSGLCI
jgi:hypothetical protein